ncbi:hypothetical protein ABHZ35_16160, partial [Bacteroides uniformis]
ELEVNSNLKQNPGY